MESKISEANTHIIIFGLCVNSLMAISCVGKFTQHKGCFSNR